MEEITVVQDFMSDDFFTSTANKQSFRKFVIDLRKSFDDEEVETPLSRWSGQRGELQNQLMRLDGTDPDATLSFYRDLLNILGYFTGEYDITVPINADGTEASYLEVNSASIESLKTLLVFGDVVEDVESLLDKHAATLLQPISLPVEDSETTEDFDSVAALLSARFTAEEPPAFALVLAGKYVLVTEQERWQEGRYVAIDLSLLFERNDTKRAGAVDRFLALASAAALAPQADESIWFTNVLDESVKFTESVSDDLREAVRESIEIIANDVVRRRQEQGLEPLPQSQAQELAKQALRFLYRILFILYAEASPELDVVPAGTTEYQAGYSLDRLRDLTLVPVLNSSDGTHLYDSLAVLFRLIQDGHNDLRVEDRKGVDEQPEQHSDSEGLVFHSLEADLFHPEATRYIDEVKLSNEELQSVLSRLLMTKETGKRDRGFISYAELGINQLGRVYEGLMSYTGFFAETDLFEVAPRGKADKGSWVVPVSEADEIEDQHFVRYQDQAFGEWHRVRHPRGSFVFRLSGRERQQSASYYTPEVLTRFTVSQALEELLTDETSAEDILNLTVCEPALGSGAFAIEAVSQLAQAYLQRRQEELDTRIDPSDYPAELQKVKAYIALHNVYGVDLNSTAVELAEVSLWMSTMVQGLAAPWFGLRLRRGNSLVGARRSSFSKVQVSDKSWLKDSPIAQPVGEHLEGGRIYQFLLPGAGWGAAADSKEGKKLAPEQAKALRTWRNSTRLKLTTTQIKRLQKLSQRVDQLWDIALVRLTIAESEMRRSIPLWGHEQNLPGSTVTRAQIEEALDNARGAYRRLRTVMDAWAALWFWPLTEPEIEPPSVDEWISDLETILGQPFDPRGKSAAVRKHGQQTLDEEVDWTRLNDAEDNDVIYSEAVSDLAAFIEETPWLKKTQEIASEQAFFHWELDFATVFDRGGFDLQVGNPPWVRPDFEEDAYLAEFDVWWSLAGMPSRQKQDERRVQTLKKPGAKKFLINGATDIESVSEFLKNPTVFPLITGTRPDLYRCFMEQTWNHQSKTGTVALIHPETHFTDEKAISLREETYRRLRRHWHFINELHLYEIHHLVSYGVHVYASVGDPDFIQASSLYHPATVERSLLHNGEGAEPGIKTPEGEWDLRPHANRVVHVDSNVLRDWHNFLGDDEGNPSAPAMVYSVNQSTESVLEKLSGAHRIDDLDPAISGGWNETTDRSNGRFVLEWGQVDDLQDSILQGPHLHVYNPQYKTPNATMAGNQDWSDVDLEQLPASSTPITRYKPVEDGKYDSSYTHWKVGDELVPARDYYRIAWRTMAANTGERTLIPTIIPPGATHVHAVHSIALPSQEVSALIASVASMGSLLGDLAIRAVPKSTIGLPQINRQPRVGLDSPVINAIALRIMRLICLTEAYKDLWDEACYLLAEDDAWTHPQRFALSSDLSLEHSGWTEKTPLRLDSDRYQAQVEIDALVALGLGVTADELGTVYRTQFPVMYGYDRGRSQGARWYDANGRLVPRDVKKAWDDLGDRATAEDLTATNEQGYTYEYVPPFITLDREEDMRIAYEEFQRRFGDSL